jgi:sugar phosphate isomerase/epimerase
MRIGVDSYSYHRLLGELRAGEDDPGERLRDGGEAVIAEARRLSLDGVSLETCYLEPPETLDVEVLRAAAGPLELVLAWGAPEGLELGAAAGKPAELAEWIAAAARLGCQVLRIVAAGPRLRPRAAAELPNLVQPLRAAAAHARSRGIVLALENHGDLTAAELEWLLDRVGGDALGVCFDTANALRVGDDPVEAAQRLAPAVRLLHLKDCEPLEEVTDPVAGPRSVPYGTGVVPVGAVLDVLEQAGFRGLVCVEIAQLGPGADERALVADGVRWLRARNRSSLAATRP